MLKYNLYRKIRISLGLMFGTQAYNAAEDAHATAMIKELADKGFQEPVPDRSIIRRRVRAAFMHTFTAAVFGCMLSVAARLIGGYVGWIPVAVTIPGTLILLWATLGLVGWEVQTIDGESLAEHANRWIFAGLYWIGTALIVMGAVYTISPPLLPAYTPP